MNARIALVGVAGGGLLATALLQAAAAAADAPSDTGADAFTIGNYTFDPYTITVISSGNVATVGPVEGFATVGPLSSSPPLLQLGGGTVFGSPLAPQSFEVFNSSGTPLADIDTSETVTNLLGMTNTEFTVDSVTPLVVYVSQSGSASASVFPATGSVYDVFNLGNGVENVYTATPGASGTVTDTLVTPSGNINLDSLVANINAANPLQPGDAFTGLAASGIANAKDAFTIGGYTLDPVSGTGASATEGFTPVDSLASAPPLLNFGGGSAFGAQFAPQDFTVYSGATVGATDVGTITTGEDVTNLFGLTNTELTVIGFAAASGQSASALPTLGTVYDAFNLGNGVENVYTASPGSSGTVTDTLVTPYGNVNLDSLVGGFNAANPLNPGDAVTGLLGNTSAGNADAFAIGGTTFDPFSTSSSAVDGFTPFRQLFGAPPLLTLGGGTPSLGGTVIPLATQSFDVFNGTRSSATDVGSITTSEDVTNLLGLTNTELTVTGATAAAGDTSAQAAALPTTGSVYDVFNLGNGIENVYTALPGAGGTVTDTLVTPLGNINLSSLFGGIDAAMPLNPADAFTSGLDVATAASTVDPLSFLGL